MASRLIEYNHNDSVLEGYFACPDEATAPRPGVIIVHAWGGRDDFVGQRANELAELGYAALAIDVYGKGILGSGPDENSQLMQPFLEDRALLRDRLLAGLETLKAQPEVDNSLTAVTGYCFGGLCALDLVRAGADIRGAVSFHGLFSPPGIEGKASSAKVLALHGWDDPMVPPTMVVDFANEMSQLGIDWQLHGYGGTLHAFTHPEANDANLGAFYNADANRRSWQAMQNFLEEVLA